MADVLRSARDALDTAVNLCRCFLAITVMSAVAPPPFDKRPGSLCPVPVEADGGRGLFLVCHYAEAWSGDPLGDDLFGGAGSGSGASWRRSEATGPWVLNRPSIAPP